MPDETALNDNTEKRLYYLSARCPCLSPHNPVLSTRYLFIPHICSAFHHTTYSFPRV